MLLAARALGLGATMTTLYLQFEKEAEAALGLPPGFHSYRLPMGRFGPVRRVALADVVRSTGPALQRLGSGKASHSWKGRLLYRWRSDANRSPERNLFNARAQSFDAF
jgi:hypothetical protein